MRIRKRLEDAAPTCRAGNGTKSPPAPNDAWPEAKVAPLNDPTFFSGVFVEAGVPTWPNGYQYAPSALYAEMREAGALHLAAAQ